MSIKLDINFDDFEKWLTPEIMENVFRSVGFDVELKDEFKKDCNQKKSQQKIIIKDGENNG